VAMAPRELASARQLSVGRTGESKSCAVEYWLFPKRKKPIAFLLRILFLIPSI
jgi:hypothetical protein